MYYFFYETLVTIMDLIQLDHRQILSELLVKQGYYWHVKWNNLTKRTQMSQLLNINELIKVVIFQSKLL